MYYLAALNETICISVRDCGEALRDGDFTGYNSIASSRCCTTSRRSQVFSVQALCPLCLCGGFCFQSTSQTHRGHRGCTEKRSPSSVVSALPAAGALGGPRLSDCARRLLAF